MGDHPNIMLSRIKKVLQLWWFPFAFTGILLLFLPVSLGISGARLEGLGGYLVELVAGANILLLPVASIVSLVHTYRAAKRRHIVTALTYVVCAASSAIAFAVLLLVISAFLVSMG